ncbi:MAG: sulfatase-like hydrolase/transferase [Verrucomicrobiaceae bacterium]
MKPFLLSLLCASAIQAEPADEARSAKSERPNIILVMTDDQGWGQTGYNGHPVLKTPNLDAMAANGLRLDRFYAAPNCSPARASVLTGRSNDRTTVLNHGHALRRQEKTLPAALQQAGYATGHFGKWHLNGYSGPGAPILATDSHHPGVFGFDTWYSVTNFFDLNPLMSRNGSFEDMEGDSSEIIVDEALRFISEKSKEQQPFFTVIWYGTPHLPFRALEKDKAPFKHLPPAAQEHYGELVAMDRSIGTLRAGLRKLDIHENTLIWFNSDNGGLQPKKGVTPTSVADLRGFKGSIYEGGIRVPCVIEWPAGIPKSRRTSHPAGIVDIFPTIADILDLPDSSMLKPIDGLSLLPLFEKETGPRKKPLFFRHTDRLAVIDNDFKLLKDKKNVKNYQLYNLTKDPSESSDLIQSASHIDVGGSLSLRLEEWNQSVDASLAGKDFPEGTSPDPILTRNWTTSPAYAPFIEQWKKRPEFQSYIERMVPKNKSAK